MAGRLGSRDDQRKRLGWVKKQKSILGDRHGRKRERSKANDDRREWGGFQIEQRKSQERMS
jgi:hypothetical protein